MSADLRHNTRRMLQALDAYWLHWDGLPARRDDTVRSESTGEDWWHRFETYRTRVEADLAAHPPDVDALLETLVGTMDMHFDGGISIVGSDAEQFRAALSELAVRAQQHGCRTQDDAT